MKRQCEDCALKGGMPHIKCDMRHIQTHKTGEHFSADVAGPLIPSTLGNKYFVVITDNGGGDTKVYPVRTATARKLGCSSSATKLERTFIFA